MADLQLDFAIRPRPAADMVADLRVLPPDLYGLVMSAECEVQPVEVLNRVVKGECATVCQKG